MLVTGVGVLEQGWAVRLRKVPGFNGRQKKKLNQIAHMTDRANNSKNFDYDKLTAYFIVKCLIDLKNKVERDQTQGELGEGAILRKLYLNHFLNDPEFDNYLQKYSDYVAELDREGVVLDIEKNNVVEEDDDNGDDNVVEEDVEEYDSSGDDHFIANSWTQRTLHAAEWKPPGETDSEARKRPSSAPVKPSAVRPSRQKYVPPHLRRMQ